MLPPACSGAYPFQSDVGTMGLFLGAAFATTVLCVMTRCLGNSRALELSTRVALTGTLVLLTPAASRASALMYCVPTTLSATAVGVLDGGQDIASAMGPFDTQSIMLLKSNPYFVCWATSGKHTGAASVAFVTAVTLVVAGPLALFLWVRRDPWLRSQLEKEPSRRGCAAQVIFWNCKYRRDDVETCNLSLGGGRSSEPPSRPATSLAPVLTDYRPWAWYTKFLDIYFAVFVAALQSTMPRPKTLPDIAAKSIVIIFGSLMGSSRGLTFLRALTSLTLFHTVSLSLAAHSLFMHPFNADRTWMGQVGFVFD